MKRRRILSLTLASAGALVSVHGIDRLDNPARVALAQQPVNLTVSAAISLSNALEDLKTVYQQNNPNVKITYNFGASGALAQQIQQGAPADVFFSAANKQMEALDKANLLLPETRRNLLTNRLGLIAPKNGFALASFKDLTDSRVKRIAIGEPRSVPVGQYSQELLTNLGIWQQIQPKVVFGNNVRQVLTFVETGSAGAGIVYTTDAKESDKVQVRATAPANSHSPIVYPVAAIKGSRHAGAARAFVEFLASERAKAVFQKYGFGIAES